MNVTCFIWSPLTSLLINEHVPFCIWTFAPLLLFRLGGKRGRCSLGFPSGTLTVTFWLAGAAQVTGSLEPSADTMCLLIIHLLDGPELLDHDSSVHHRVNTDTWKVIHHMYTWGLHCMVSLCWSPTLPASLSGTFLQTLPDLVMPQHWRDTLYLRAAVHQRSQNPPKGLGTNMIVEAT